MHDFFSQETQLSQRGRATLKILNLGKSLKVTQGHLKVDRLVGRASYFVVIISSTISEIFNVE